MAGRTSAAGDEELDDTTRTSDDEGEVFDDFDDEDLDDAADLDDASHLDDAIDEDLDDEDEDDELASTDTLDGGLPGEVIEELEDEQIAVAAARTLDEDLDAVGDDDDELEGLRDGEFVCSSCHLARRETQLADPKRLLCRDCV